VDEQRCIQVRVTDTDAFKETENFRERIRIKAVPLNFRADVTDVLPEVTTATLTPDNDAVIFTICFPECPYIQGAPYQVGIVAYDDACALPLFDTLRVAVNIQPPPNQAPYYTTTTSIVNTINEGDLVSWEIVARDDDGDTLSIGLINDGFLFPNVGMAYEVLEQVPGLYRARLTWDSRCDVYDFTQKTNFNINVVADDNDRCRVANTILTTFNLNIKLPGNADPKIDSDLTPQVDERRVENVQVKVFETLDFNVFGSDSDGDFLELKVNGQNFDVNTLGIQVLPATGNGNVSTPLGWTINCNTVDFEALNIAEKDFEFQFIIVDNANKCRFYKADTLDVVVKVLPPDNQAPQLLNPLSLNEVPIDNNQIEIFHDQTIKFRLTGTDTDSSPVDRLSLTFPNQNSVNSAFVFNAAVGVSPVESEFEWTPTCSVFQDGVFLNEYDLTFYLEDDRCHNDKKDSVVVHVIVKDYENEEVKFLPANVVTPNGDGCNDYFAMENFDFENLCGAPEDLRAYSLPLDNCRGEFVKIQIMNRWGREIFSSNQRDFRWFAKNQSAGVYYYYLTFTNQQFRGSLSVRF